MADDLLPHSDHRGDDRERQEHADEMISIAPGERAPPHGQGDEGAEVGQAQADERSISVLEERRDQAEYEEDAERQHPPGDPPWQLRTGLRWAEKRGDEHGQNEDLFPRRSPRWAERVQHAVKRQQCRQDEDAALWTLRDGDGDRDQDRDSEHDDAVTEDQRHGDDPDSGSEQPGCTNRIATHLCDHGGHVVSILPIRRNGPSDSVRFRGRW